MQCCGSASGPRSCLKLYRMNTSWKIGFFYFFHIYVSLPCFIFPSFSTLVSKNRYQCCGSGVGSIGSVCFWASWIRQLKVVDLHRLDADPDSTNHPDADPDSDVYLIWMRRRIRIRIFTQMRSDPDPDPSFQIKAQSLEKVLNRRIFHTFRLVICKLIRIRFWIQLIITLMRVRVRIRILILFDPDPDFHSIRIQIFIRCIAGCGSRLPK